MSEIAQRQDGVTPIHAQSNRITPGDIALDDSVLIVAAQRASILGCHPISIGTVRGNQGNGATLQPFPQPVIVIAIVVDHP